MFFLYINIHLNLTDFFVGIFIQTVLSVGLSFKIPCFGGRGRRVPNEISQEKVQIQFFGNQQSTD